MAQLVGGYAMRSVGEPLSPLEYEVQPGPGQALIEVVGCGVCHTDLGFLHEGVPTRHPLPLVLGHEISGVVREAPGAPELEGRSVVVPAVLPCGECELCARGRGEICRRQVFPGNDVHGGFASHVVVPARYLQPVDLPRGPALAKLAVTADAVSTAYQAVARSGLGAGDVAVFVGVGGVGGFGAQIAKARGARVVAIDVCEERLAALAAVADWTVCARDRAADEVKREVRGLAKEHGLPPAEWRVFETSGTGPGQELAFGLLGFGGYLGVVGYHPRAVTLRLSNLMAFDARAEGTWGCHPSRYPEVLALVRAGLVALDPFVELHPLAEVNEVLERLRRGELRRRPILLPGES
ncbi:MAG: 6-hydroxycyclohex-1-ene-1-carbonyl-CoA dehydrogenase [Planctomycetota bacterium]